MLIRSEFDDRAAAICARMSGPVLWSKALLERLLFLSGGDTRRRGGSI